MQEHRLPKRHVENLKIDTPAVSFNRLKESLELPKAILLQLRETCLFNSLIDQAIKDIDEILEVYPPSDPK